MIASGPDHKALEKVRQISRINRTIFCLPDEKQKVLSLYSPHLRESETEVSK